MLTKDEIRQNIISECKLLSSDSRMNSARNIIDNLNKLIKSANSIAIYHAYGFEFDLSHVIKYCLKLGKKVYQPIAYKETRIMRFAEVVQYAKNDEIRKVFYSLGDEVLHEIEWYNIDLVLMPLVAVSKSGFRLGKGGGYYDATFATTNTLAKKPILCGVGFDMQIIDEIPVESWDIKLNYFVSEKRILNF